MECPLYSHSKFLVIHVDDFAIASSDQAMTDDLIATLKKRYVNTVSTSLDSFLGNNMTYLDDGSVLFIQPRYINELMVEYSLKNVSPPRVPMSSLFNDDHQNDSPPFEYTRYMKLLGKLIFIIKHDQILRMQFIGLPQGRIVLLNVILKVFCELSVIMVQLSIWVYTSSSE